MDGVTISSTHQFSTVCYSGIAKGVQEGTVGKREQRQVPLERELGRWIGKICGVSFRLYSD
jgi:hypothetical protein